MGFMTVSFGSQCDLSTHRARASGTAAIGRFTDAQARAADVS
jgi:hypothetical protein